MADIDKVKYLIIGNSAGGIGAAEAIRAVDKRGSIAIVSEEPYPVYSRPLISEFLAKKRSLEQILFRPAGFYEKNNIQTLLGKKVVRIDTNKRSAELEGGDKITWEKLLLAPGGTPIIPQMNGTDLKGVFTFTTLDDAKAIDKFLGRKRNVKAVVIGGGLIGISASEALVKRGIEVTVVEMMERILGTVLDEVTSALGRAALTAHGVEVVTGHTASGIKGTRAGNASGVTLDNGRLIPCNLVVIAIGVRPRIDLVAKTTVKTNRGILVDRHLATSSPDIYACGDASEAYDFVLGENRVTPVWPNAYLGGRVAGFNMAGVPTQYQGGTALNALKYFGLDVVSAGMVTPLNGNYETLSQKYGDVYHKVVLRDGKVVGLVFAGKIEKAGIIYNLMKDKIDVSRFKQALISDTFGLASLPEELWREWLELPSSATVLPVARGGFSLLLD